MAYSVTCACNLPLYVADYAHLFRRYGVSANVTAMQGPPVMNAALVGGSLDVGVGGATQAGLIARGAHIKYIAGWMQLDAFSIFGPPTITNIRSWLGDPSNVIAVGPANGAPELALIQYMMAKHISLTHHARFLVNSSGTVAGLAALTSRKVGAVVLSDVDTTVSTAEHAGFKRLADTAALNVPLLGSAVLVPTAWGQAHAAAVEGFLKATALGTEMAQHQPKLAAEALRAALHITNPATLQATVRATVPDLLLNPRVRLAAIREFLTLTHNPAAKNLNGSQYIDNQYVQALVSQGFFKTLGAQG